MRTLDLTRDGLIRALSAAVAARPAVDAAVAARAERVASRIRAAGVDAAVSRRAAGAYAVTASGPGLFAREFGSLEVGPDPVVAQAASAGRGHD